MNLLAFMDAQLAASHWYLNHLEYGYGGGEYELWLTAWIHSQQEVRRHYCDRARMLPGHTAQTAVVEVTSEEKVKLLLREVLTHLLERSAVRASTEDVSHLLGCGSALVAREKINEWRMRYEELCAGGNAAADVDNVGSDGG